ncbi:MAG: hypothetical protein OEO77_00025 [Acidimicrobiia bacterium]|nr:hypothetical protein [Acidimicrobiia bacterium]
MRPLTASCALVLLLAACGGEEVVEPVAVAPPATASTLPAVAPSSSTTTADAVGEVFEDSFEGVLDAGWAWLPTSFSLEQSPGWLTIDAEDVAPPVNLLRRPAPAGPFVVETLVRFQPQANFQFAGIIVQGEDPAEFVQFGRAFCDGTTACVGDGLYFDNTTSASGDNFATVLTGQRVVYLRLAFDGTDTYAASYSADGTEWTYIGDQVGVFHPTWVGLIAHQGTDISAEFAHFVMTWEPTDDIVAIAAGPRPEPTELNLDHVMRDDSLKKRRQLLTDDLIGFGAASRWMDNHPMATEDFERLNDLIQGAANRMNVAIDLSGDRNVLAVLASFGPPTVCQWTAEGVPLDDIQDAMIEAVEPNTQDAGTASSFAGLIIAAARNVTCPEFDQLWELRYAGGLDVEVVGDDFDHSGSGWSTSTSPSGYLLYEGGFYRMLPEFDAVLLSAWPEPHTDVVMTAFMRPLGGTGADTGYGVVCRADPAGDTWNSTYLFGLFADGNYQILRYDDMAAPVILAEGVSAAIHTGDAWNRILAVCDGSRLALMVNGILVDQVEDTVLQSGSFGFVAWTSASESAEIVVNTVVVTEPVAELTGLLDAVAGQPVSQSSAPASPVSEPSSDLPAYSEVVAAFPAGVEPCISEGKISGGEGGNYTILGGAILDPDGGLFCIGSRYTTSGATVLPDGTALPDGSFVTIDGVGNIVQVSVFD